MEILCIKNLWIAVAVAATAAAATTNERCVIEGACAELVLFFYFILSSFSSKINLLGTED